MASKESAKEEFESISYSLWQVETFCSEGNLIMAANLLCKLDVVLKKAATKNKASKQLKILLERFEISRIKLTQAMTKDLPGNFLK